MSTHNKERNKKSTHRKKKRKKKSIIKKKQKKENKKIIIIAFYFSAVLLTLYLHHIIRPQQLSQTTRSITTTLQIKSNLHIEQKKIFQFFAEKNKCEKKLTKLNVVSKSPNAEKTDLGPSPP